MTPHDVLMEFETNRTAPVAAMRAALSAREEMLPAFVAEFERALHTSLENLPYADSYGIMLEILGEWGDSRAYLPLAAFLRLPGDTLDVDPGQKAGVNVPDPGLGALAVGGQPDDRRRA